MWEPELGACCDNILWLLSRRGACVCVRVHAELSWESEASMFWFYLAVPTAWRSARARDQSPATVATTATALDNIGSLTW